MTNHSKLKIQNSKFVTEMYMLAFEILLRVTDLQQAIVARRRGLGCRVVNIPRERGRVSGLLTSQCAGSHCQIFREQIVRNRCGFSFETSYQFGRQLVFRALREAHAMLAPSTTGYLIACA